MPTIAAIVFLPLIAAVLVGLTVRRIPAWLAQLITCGAMGVSAVLSGYDFYRVALLGQAYQVELLPWIQTGTFVADWVLRVDVLTAVMLVVVTWVSCVVHIYSVGYMSHDPHRPRFMAYLSLFTFFMLMLVTADNFLQLFVGWEGVGLCSYLLIGFWFKKESANQASMKAFLVNRVADFAFILGIFTVFVLFGTIEFDAVFAGVAAKTELTFAFLGMEFHALTLAAVLLFIGCMGKSAQLGLHTWLPDAMEGPTPVSALIHAATMVTAGVFLVARCSPLFEHAPDALAFVAIIGALTAIFAASIGLVQNDIKRVIAYSTCSQLGYMFFACGVSAYAAGIFHLMTHAFFKALLFLGAGSVIHASSDEQDIRHMGGLAKKIPVTYAYMLLGSLALAGLPLFAGYYSKDIILEASFAADTTQGKIAYALGVIAALMTAFYSWRLLFLTFHGTSRASKKVQSHVHESPPVMLLPLVVLALGAVAAGWLGYHWLGMVDPEGAFWRGAIVVLPEHNTLEGAHHIPALFIWLPTVMGVAGILLAYVFYIRKPALPGRVAAAAGGLYRFLVHKWYFDEAYDRLFVRPTRKLGALLWKGVDVAVIDNLGPNGAAAMSQLSARVTSRVQTGYVYHYAFVMLIGVLALVSWILFFVGNPA